MELEQSRESQRGSLSNSFPLLQRDGVDELGASTRTQPAYRLCRIMCFTVMWLQAHVPESNVSPPGLQTVCADRDLKRSSKCKGSGTAVNNTWCNQGHATVEIFFPRPGY